MLGILCGLESEAAIVRRLPNVLVACAGARPQKARWLARELVQKGAKRLLSFGIAGALEPQLPIGTMVIGAQVAASDGSWMCDSAWVGELMRIFPEAHCGPVWGSETLIATGREKRALYQRSRAIIVDMESQCAAQIAAEAQLPFAVLRVVCDHADMDVPKLVMAAINEDGSINAPRALWHLIRHPGQVPDLFHVMRGMGKAMKVLRGSGKVLQTNEAKT